MPENREQRGGTGESAGTLVEIRNADIRNGGNLIISGLDISVAKGDIVYLVGRVGSGKSSILKTIMAEIPLVSGSGRVCGYELKNLKAKEIPYLRRKLGVVFQDFQLLAEQSVMANLRFVLRSTGWDDAKKIEDRCMEVLRMVGMETKSHKMPHQLSGGEQQRIAIARALLNSPELILADEPTGNLDAETADGIMNLFMKIHSEYSPAILIITHNRSILEKYPGRVFLCSNGTCDEITDKALSAEDDMPDDC